MTAQPLLVVENITVSYGGQNPVVENVSFAVAGGAITAVVGESLSLIHI